MPADWSNASRSDLVLLRRAVRRGWPVPAEKAAEIIAGLGQLLDGADDRMTLALARVLIAVSQAERRATP